MARRLEGPRTEEAVLELTEVVRAAGGVVLRVARGRAEVVVVHRPRYDDWSLPKGKLLDDESAPDAALREVREETGLRCRPVEELPASSYLTSEGAPKVVRYWLMEPIGSTELLPTEEVDEARWVPFEDAMQTLSHEVDRELLASVATRDAPTYLVRHGKAGSRSAWSGDDRLRPLSKAGRRQAKGLAPWFADRRVDRIMSSPAVRCVETVRPLADRRGVEIEVREELAEAAPLGGAVALLDGLAASHAVLSAHGDLIPALVERAELAGAMIVGERGWKKGAVWILEREASVVVRATFVPPPDSAPKTGVGRRSRERSGRRRGRR